MVFLFLFFIPLFFYKLSQTSLVSWDEAWYGEIAKNIILSGNLFQLQFNHMPYFDHPPVGFWLIALGEKIFGTNELGVRFVPAFLGFLSIVVIYYLGRQLFNKQVGFLSAIALPSATWFLFRARSGNLDVILTFFFLLTTLLALKASKQKKYLLPFTLSFTLLTLTKSLIPFTILPALILIFWGNKAIKLKDWIFSGFIFLAIFLGWVFNQYQLDPNSVGRYFVIGAPGFDKETSYLDNLKLMKDYLYVGVGKWFWPGIISLILGLFLKQKRFYILALFFITFYTPFIFSNKGHIWHLIPLHPILILSSIGFTSIFVEKYFKTHKILLVIIAGGVFFLSFLQIKQNWIQNINVPAFVTDEAILSREAKKFPQKDLYIDDEFTPAAAFYSDKKIYKIGVKNIPELFNDLGNFLLITKQEKLDEVKIEKSKYEIIKTDRDKILVRSF